MKIRPLAIALMLAPIAFTSAIAFERGGAERVEPINAAPTIDMGGLVNETPSAWFVEFAGKPRVEGGNARDLKKEQDAFRTNARNASLEFTERRAFNTLWNGLSVNIDPKSLGKLARVPGVKALYPVVQFALPETQKAEPDLFTALALTGADIAQSDLGYTGAGVKVAVMDTGIDYDHPDLGGCFGPGCKVAFGYDLVGDDYNADPGSPSYNPIPSPDPDPDDCGGHGTHVAGIVGADGTVTGVAPGVTLGAYRVFGCEGSTDADIMLAAMEMALADGMDVLNMSIGSSYQWPQYPTAVASDRMVNRGMVVVASIGNSGANGTYAAGAPGVGEKVIGVASFDNTFANAPYFEVDGQQIAYNGITGALLAPTSGTEEIVYVGLACGGGLDADPAGKVALVSRGSCTFATKGLEVLNAGATAIVIHNNTTGALNATFGGEIPIVGVTISQADGMYIRGLEPVNMTWTDQTIASPVPTGGLISSFSSYGLAPDLSLKPDIGAPGGHIWSTYPIELGSYASLGGTSMASPHTAGAVALLLEAKPKTKSRAVGSILQNSADPALWNGNPGLGLLDSVHRQGAGMLDIDDTILATTEIEPGEIAVGEGEAGPKVYTLKIRNSSPNEVTYDLYEEWWTITTSGTFAADVGYWLSDQWVEFSQTSVTVPPGEKVAVKVTIHPATDPDLGTYGGYIVFAPQGGGQTYRVPYAGIAGDYQAIPVLDANPYGLPWSTGCETCTMEGDDVAEFWVNIGHQVRTLRMEVFNASSGKSMGNAYDLDYFGRSTSGGSYYAFPWDGTTISGNKFKTLPDGEYVIVISVLKALGDHNNPDHWESWNSPVITIDRS